MPSVTPLISTDGNICIPTFVNAQAHIDLGRYLDLTELPDPYPYHFDDYWVPNSVPSSALDLAGWYIPTWNQYFDQVSGETLKVLNSSLSNLREIQKATHLVFDATVFASLGTEARQTAHPTEFSYDCILKIINGAQISDASYGLHLSVLRVILGLDRICAVLRAELSRMIKAVKRALATQRRRVFCGMNWCKRAWFLLHGSHPPKGEITLSPSLFVGCVQT
jgi:hypothetical protein